MKVLYTAVSHASGDGRNGHVRTDDGSGARYASGATTGSAYSRSV